jgi:hypothetical protein
MAEVERLIQAPTIEVYVVSPNSAAARRCLATYFREIAARFERGFNPDEGDQASEEEMTPPTAFSLSLGSTAEWSAAAASGASRSASARSNGCGRRPKRAGRASRVESSTARH